MNIAIIGTGAYGIALSLMFYKNNCNIKMWSKFDEEKEEILKYRENKKVLSGIKIPEGIVITTNLKEAIKDAKIIVIAIPVNAITSFSLSLSKIRKRGQHILITSKGIDSESHLFVADLLKKNIRTKEIAVVSGPSFAIDVANNDPIGLSLATKNRETEKLVKEALENDSLKLRVTRDVIGVEICGAVKNVVAIAAGMLKGMKCSESTQAMLITEALHDIKELIRVLGGTKKTITSFAGFGDLLLTCTSEKSRNFTLGYMIGQNKPRTEIDEYIKNTTIEGLLTLDSLYKLLKNKKIKIPIINQIRDIILGQKHPSELKSFLITK